MAKTAYPGTTQQPIQILDFLLKDNMLVRAIFLPQPDHTGSAVGHVALACVHAGTSLQLPLPSQTRPQTILDAAKLAWMFAQSESKRVGKAIESVRLQGEEFLERSDVEAITNNALTVTVN